MLPFALALAALQETALFTIPEDYASCPLEAAFGAGGNRAAVVIRFSDGRSAVWLDGALSEPHTFVNWPVFSHDGAHVAWSWGDRKGKEREQWEVVLDGKTLKKWDWVGPMAFQPGGAELAYWAGDGVRLDREGVYVGGEYICLWGKKKTDGFRDPGFHPPQWSPDGRRMAFLGSKGSGATVYVDGKLQGSYSWATSLAWSPDGKDLVWAALDGEFASRIFHGKKTLGQEFEAAGAPALGAGGAVAYVAARKQQFLLVFRDEIVPGAWDGLGTPAVSPDGKRVAVAANRGRKTARSGWVWVDTTWMDGGEEWGEDPSAGGACFLVLDGEQLGQDWLRVVGPRFSADSRHVTARVREKAGWRVVLDAQASALFDEVGEPRFLPDGAVEFGARRGRDVLHVRFDGSAPPAAPAEPAAVPGQAPAPPDDEGTL